MFIFLDTETTGNGPADRICQIAFKTEDGLTVNKLFNPGISDKIRKNHYLKDVANHDINDVFSMLWTAERIYRGVDAVIPAEAEFDLKGPRMGIWY